MPEKTLAQEYAMPAVIILAGGLSSRMGYPKAFLDWGGKPMCEYVMEKYEDAGIHDIIIVLLDTLLHDTWYEHLKKLKSRATIVPNSDTHLGRSHSIDLGLNYVGDDHDVFIQNVDCPGIDPKLLQRMASCIHPSQYIIPVTQGQSGHPVLIGSNLVAKFKLLRGTSWILRDALRTYERYEVDAGDTPVRLNINTIQDWLKGIKQLRLSHAIL